MTAAGVTAGLNGAAVESAVGPDTAELQTLLDRGGKITLDAGRRYVVAPNGSARTALTIRSDTELDLAGATLELAVPSRASLIWTDQKSRTRNVSIHGGHIVGNGSKQPEFSFAVGTTPTLYLPNCDALRLADLQMRDTYHYAIHAEGDDGRADNITVDGARGGGVHLSGARWKIDRIDVRNVTFINAQLCEGNPFIGRLYDTTIGSIRCENYGFGVKLQDGCERVKVASIVAIAGRNNDKMPEFLVKIQGMNDSRGRHFNRDIQIGKIVARNGPLIGLYIVYSDGVTIDSYEGEGNARLPNLKPHYGTDVLVLESNNVHFRDLRVQGVRRCGVWLDRHVTAFSADNLELAAGAAKAVPVVSMSSSALFGNKNFSGFAE